MSGPPTWVCLEFINSVWYRSSAREDALTDYRAIVEWGRRAGVLTDGEARRLLDAATRRPHEATAVYERAIATREALYGVFSSVARGAEPPAADLGALNAALGAATAPTRLVPMGTGFRRDWLDAKDDLGWLLHPIVRSAADLLTSPELARLKECPGSPGKGCNFLFVDTTKNRGRRWCSGSSCGNRARLHRHYARAWDGDSQDHGGT
jgi:predicted RNA-binding Zn ribbon-like protein